MFSKFVRFNLEEQQRFNNKEFTEFVSVLRNTDLTYPITRQWLNKIQRLSVEDLKKDPTWAYATIATSGNNERDLINYTQAIRYGKEFNQPILRAVTPIRCGEFIEELPIPEGCDDATYAPLITLFVKNAPCVLTMVVSSERGYVKAVKGTITTTTSLQQRQQRWHQYKPERRQQRLQWL